jgi:hypothetical protein
MATSIILPCLFALTIMRDNIVSSEKIVCITLAIVGIVAGIGLTCSDIYDLIHQPLRTHNRIASPKGSW